MHFSILPESPRWLYTQGRNDEADEIVKKMARVNKVDLPEKLNIVVKVIIKIPDKFISCWIKHDMISHMQGIF